jgi:hypothetical protein
LILIKASIGPLWFETQRLAPVVGNEKHRRTAKVLVMVRQMTSIGVDAGRRNIKKSVPARLGMWCRFSLTKRLRMSGLLFV